jgi:hypothetical protein
MRTHDLRKSDSGVVTLVFAAVLAVGVLWFLRRSADGDVSPGSVGPSVAPSQPTAPRVTVAPNSPTATASENAFAAAPSRTEVVAYLQHVYRQEELARELELEQERFAAEYWQSDRSGPTLDQIRARRTEMIRLLSAEANAVLGSMCPDESGAPIELAPFFDDDHPAPNVRFLSPESRRTFVAALFASGPANSEQLTALAAQTLSGAEFDTFWKWNDRAAVALRSQLVGFEPTETEFLTLLNHNRAFDPSADDNGSNALAAALGPQRAAELRLLEAPDIQTAVHDLDRLGLPLSSAQWLADLRQQASAAIQQIWSDEALPSTLKAERVRELEQSYGQTIASKLGLQASTLDELGPVQ